MGEKSDELVSGAGVNVSEETDIEVTSGGGTVSKGIGVLAVSVGDSETDWYGVQVGGGCPGATGRFAHPLTNTSIIMNNIRVLVFISVLQ